WGYETGLNEHGVAIGNEGVFTKPFKEASGQWRRGHGPPLGVMGMELVRLALERSATARQAVELMGQMVADYGQFGSALPTKDHADGGYDNAYVVCDPQEAWVLETAGRHWVARQATEGFASISNALGIRSTWDLGSDDVESHAARKGWWPQSTVQPFDFAYAYGDDETPAEGARLRAGRTRQLLAQRHRQVSEEWMMRIARDHYEGTFLGGPAFDPANPDAQSLCMHVSPAGFTWGNTASSAIAVLPRAPDELPVLWWTPGPPCNGCYLPFFVHGRSLPETVSRAGSAGDWPVAPADVVEDTFAPDSYWWLFRRLMDVVKGDPVRSLPGFYASRNRLVRERFDEIERQVRSELPETLRKAADLRDADPDGMACELDAFTERWVAKVTATVRELLRELE
ncbi:MAG: C69 family dipeptidase, partial [Dehalococcoidia bacterium]